MALFACWRRAEVRWAAASRFACRFAYAARSSGENSRRSASSLRWPAVAPAAPCCATLPHPERSARAGERSTSVRRSRAPPDERPSLRPDVPPERLRVDSPLDDPRYPPSLPREAPVRVRLSDRRPPFERLLSSLSDRLSRRRSLSRPRPPDDRSFGPRERPPADREPADGLPPLGDEDRLPPSRRSGT